MGSLELYVGTKVHRLPFATEVCVRESLNKHYYVTFRYLRADDDMDRYDSIIEGAEIRFPLSLSDNVKGQRFVIRAVDEKRQQQKVYKEVEAYHVGYSLSKYYLDDFVDFQANVPPTLPLGMIANNTPFSFNIDASITSKDLFEFGEKQKNELLSDMLEIYNAEVSYDNYTINFLSRVGGNYGTSIRYRKNLAGITRKSSELERVTRLFGYGKNGLTIEGYGGHSEKYILSQYFDVNNPFDGRIDFPDIDDQAALLEAMQKYLRENELPKVAYDIDFVQLEKVDAEFAPEAIRGVGDTITVKDDVLGFHFEARVSEYDRYPFEPRKARVVLSNYRDYTLGDYIYKATVAGQQAKVYTSKNAVLKGIKYDDSITLVDGMGMAVSDDFDRVRVRLGQVGPGDYGLTMYNKAGQRTLWQDATTGDANFTGRISGSSFRTNPTGYPFIELTSDNNLFRAAKSADSFIEIEANPTSYAAPIIKHIDGSTVVYTGAMGGSYFSLVSNGSYDISAQDGAVRISGNPVMLNSNVHVMSPFNLHLSSWDRLLVGGITIGSILNGIYSRLSALESQ